MTLPHRRGGLSVLWMAVWCPFRRPSMYRPVHCEFMRSEVLDLTTIIPATLCHHRSYVMQYSKYRKKREKSALCAWRGQNQGTRGRPYAQGHARSPVDPSQPQDGLTRYGGIACKQERILGTAHLALAQAADMLACAPRAPQPQHNQALES